ncbi:chemotaxis protein CheA [Halanaeroarchaeum sulfurireducens]|uniref:Chemotaxis protein CheA n=1 Tax=Halanaeroarchaeum sulfurireducens TaxID=1604004 RepID=A0A0N9MJ05_9EURY|nr:chemotaxis protein CheA [Halanaeroarchaeum sulfurireducens]ALG82243.1 chemotaxis protein CheA [Halanaeroarchaeum sulfurireducens]
MDEYLEAFVREGEEHVTDLNNALLCLESNPGDEEAMDQIFRTAHTLKGNFGAMGFEDASDLAHAVEDLLDAMRQGEIEVTSERMDHIFAGIDEIEGCLDEIETHGEVKRTVRPTIDDLRDVLSESETEDAPSEFEDDEAATGSPDIFEMSRLEEANQSVFHVTVEMDETDMPGVDAMFVLEDITEDFEVVDAVPSVDAIEEGEYDDTFDLAIATQEADVAETITSLGKVSDATATELDLGDQEAEQTFAETDEVTEASSEESGGKAINDIQSVRVDVDQLDELHGLVEQLVTTRIKLRRSVEVDNRRAEDELDELDKITSNLQDTVMDMRLVPMKKIVGKFPRLVRDLAREEDKQVDFQIVGDDVELDRTILTEISDPLMHLLRNAVDHGIESPEEREAAGKDPTGTITLEAERERDRVNVTVSDDGRGIDHDVIRRKAVEKGIYTESEVEQLPEQEVAQLIFHPGFSTNEEITDVSGRGVGMDVVHDTVTRLDGSVSVESEEGEGTTITLTLPVTVAIVKVLFVESGGEEYGIPIKSVDEISRMRPVKTVDGEEVVTYGDTVYPLVRLGGALNVPGETKNGEGMLVKVRESERKVALHCDDVREQEEVVVKPFEGILSGIPGLSGAAVLGEGDVVTILDVATL